MTYTPMPLNSPSGPGRRPINLSNIRMTAHSRLYYGTYYGTVWPERQRVDLRSRLALREPIRRALEIWMGPAGPLNLGSLPIYAALDYPTAGITHAHTHTPVEWVDWGPRS